MVCVWLTLIYCNRHDDDDDDDDDDKIIQFYIWQKCFGIQLSS